MELRETTQAILDSDNPAVLLKLADRYVEMYNASPEVFVLPREHIILRPIIEVFHDNLGDFVGYVKAVRNVLAGVAKSDVHEFYRTVSTRYVQQVRRARAERAVKAVERMLGRSLEPDEKVRLVKKLEQHWGARRTAMLKHAKGSSRLSIDDRTVMLKEFWDQVDKEIDEGDLPMFKF